MTIPPMRRPVRAFAFDVGGTVFDWHATIRDEVEALAKADGIAVDAPAFANDWRRAMLQGVAEVRNGERGWLNADGIARATLEPLARTSGIGDAVARSDLGRVWHRLRPWPGAAFGVAALRRTRPVVALSLLNLDILIDLSRAAGVEWDALLSCEFIQRYKTDPEVYLSAVRWLGLSPGDVMMVATHAWDLEGARAAGLQTAFIHRPTEWGEGAIPAVAPSFVDAEVSSLDELASVPGG